MNTQAASNVVAHGKFAEWLKAQSLGEVITARILMYTATGVSPEGLYEQPTNSKPPAPVAQTAVAKAKSGFKFGAGSEKELVGVNETLVAVTRMALDLCDVDFVVFDGIRTFKEQKQHVANGTSKTMASKHLDGLAVDLVPYIGGKPVWDWEGCYRIAMAMDRAATFLGCAHKIRWGGAWDRTLADFGGNLGEYESEVQAYRARHAGPDFIDGPHFEWLK